MATHEFPRALQPLALPVELVDALNQTYFLHLLANDPDKVIPPGKSLLSMLAHSRVAFGNGDESTAGKEGLGEKIRQAAHSAFWDDALGVLSSPQPSIQLHRLGLLYIDIKDALSPLFPSSHPSILALSSPLAPTTSPLHSTAILLREVLMALKQRCAPARDQSLDELMVLVNEIPSPSGIIDIKILQERNHMISKVVINIMRSILSLSEVMKEDLNKFVLGAMTEAQLKAVVHQQAKARERQLVLKLWSTPERQGQYITRERWQAWIEQIDDSTPIDSGTGKWKHRLLQALQSSTPVSCNSLSNTVADSGLPPAPVTDLPPQFLFAVPTLISIQNYIQALIIAAALRSLLRIPVYSNYSGSGHSPTATVSNFVQRVWALLGAEIETDQATSRSVDVGETKIAHLIDELIHTRRMLSEVNAEEEVRLRATAENILRPEDPVFLLLQKRAMTSLRERLFSSQLLAHVNMEHRNQIPEKLRSGKDITASRASVGSKLGFWPGTFANGSSQDHSRPNGTERPAAPPKGFEDPVLARELNRLFSKVVVCVTWIGEVWEDLVL
ncbi:hypothetical protein AX15_002825 [Amanita polypyramis BW_CC]|nr:hypothetical protein AX15_002825 [Amanita polypyramis BW_CC]